MKSRVVDYCTIHGPVDLFKKFIRFIRLCYEVLKVLYNIIRRIFKTIYIEKNWQYYISPG